jgi:NAD(P)-dependent dehydrogenase (short-subunit alcohol dehydrogenase family)
VVGLVGDSAIVTGGAQGIGLGIARELIARGASVVLFDLNEDAVNEAAATLESGKAIGFAGSVTAADDWTAAFDRASESFGPVSILANNAGWASLALIEDLDEADWDQCMDVCAKGAFLGTKEFARRADGAGAIVNTSSLNAEAATDGLAHYCAAKAAVSQLTKVAAAELAPRGIRVNAVSAGVVETEALDHFPNREQMLRAAEQRTPAGRMVEPNDVAGAVAYLCSPDADMIRGQTLIVDGGYSLLA